ncbi:MAG: glycosyltransferase family 4 protein [Anaerolineales bacterium]|nr:glycosyltransferase family 4 protein [Anaerolineales bacterium]
MAKPLHILAAGLIWPPETFIERLLRGLLARGFQITVASIKRPAADWFNMPGFHWLPVYSWEGHFVVRIFRLGWWVLKAWLGSRGDMQKIAVQINAIPNHTQRTRLWYRLLPFLGKGWDVIYFPWNSAAIDHLPLFDLGMPVVISCRGSQINIGPHDPERVDLADGLRQTFARATAVHCVSQNILQEAMKFGLDPQKTHLIHPAVDINFFQPRMESRPSRSTFHVLTTGSLIWRKGLDYALIAIRKLADQGIPVRFEIIGSGPDESQIHFTIHDLGLQEHVHLSGKLSQEQIKEKLQRIDVFLLSSLSEGISNAVLEAMSCGIPVVTTDCGGVREAVTDGVEGFVVPLRDPAAIASALQSLWQSPSLCEQMGRAGGKKIERNFNLDGQIQQWVDLYQELQKTGGLQ